MCERCIPTIANDLVVLLLNRYEAFYASSSNEERSQVWDAALCAPEAKPYVFELARKLIEGWGPRFETSPGINLFRDPDALAAVDEMAVHFFGLSIHALPAGTEDELSGTAAADVAAFLKSLGIGVIDVEDAA